MKKTLKTKICSSCKTRKNLKNFHKNKSSKDGHHHYCKKCKNESRIIRRLSDNSFRIAQNIKQKLSKYNITNEHYISILEKQKKSCSICSNTFENERTIFIDHDHSNGNVRGLLCPKCNTILGLANDNINTLLSAVNYLKQSS
jgi:hypothetical protein